MLGGRERHTGLDSKTFSKKDVVFNYQHYRVFTCEKTYAKNTVLESISLMHVTGYRDW